MKTIYFGHSKAFDFENELYKPIRESSLNGKYNIIFPHENNNELFNSKELFLSGKCDLFLTEASWQSTGMGIEMGWASLNKVPIVCLHRKGSNISGSLKTVTDKFIEYIDKDDLINQLEKII